LDLTNICRVIGLSHFT